MHRMSRTTLAVCAIAAAALLVPTTAAAGTIRGTVKYEGAVPNLPPLKMGADPQCAAKHSGPVPSDVLVLGDGQTMAHVFVRVKSGLPKQDWPAPSKPAVLDQNGCRYEPHVQGLVLGQELRILNSDGLMHNVHALPEVNKPFNMAMPASRTEAVHKFSEVESMFHIKCDVHPWMSAYVAVLEHPFFATTGKNGAFEIGNLPAGTYEIEAWHEKLGTKTATVTIGADETKSIEFKMSPPSRG